jgi:multidrug transporter EmrE-like cation transporter
MDHTFIALLVKLFFVFGAIMNLLLGIRFLKSQANEIKNFGMALILTGVAFTAWALAVITHLDKLRLWGALGSIGFIAAIVCCLAVAGTNLKPKNRMLLILLGLIAAAGVFALRTFVLPAHLAITTQGIFLFNLHPFIKAIYTVALSAIVWPAALVASKKLTFVYEGSIFRGCFIALVIAGVVLINSADPAMIFLDGCAITLIYLLLGLTFLRPKEA